jgi:hypothetical protein
MLPSMRADDLACLRAQHITWKRACGELEYKFLCVSECVYARGLSCIIFSRADFRQGIWE